jgi:methionyl-tRNA synthetase
MLKLHGNILPANVPANEFLNLEGDKMSTSRNWKLEMRDFILAFVKKENGGDQCVDMLRYYLTQIAPESKDSEFTWKGFQDAVNSELVSIFGNYVNRTFVLMHKLCGGKVPRYHTDLADEKDNQLIQDIAGAKNRIEALLEHYKFREALFEVIDLSRKGNRYMQEKEPWILAKTVAENPVNQQLIDNCLYNCLQLTANLAVLINPFLPSTARKMCHMMKVVDKILDWQNAGSMKLLSMGYSLREPQLLFRKIEDQEIADQIQILKSAAMQHAEQQPVAPASPAVPVNDLKPEIVFDDFGKIDLRTGIIIAAQKVPKADKLLQLEVDLGFEKRTILSGIAMHFEPEAIIGKQVVIVANLAPRKMRGIDSNGMILMAEDASGKLHFVGAGEASLGGWKVS